MKNILSILILLLTFNSYAQEASQYVITSEGEKIDLYNDVRFSESSVFSSNKEGKKVSYTQKKLKYLVVGNRMWKVLNVRGKINRLQEIIAFNEKYVFTIYNYGTPDYYIWDRNFNSLKRNVEKTNEVMTMVKENFKNCKELLDAMNKNINTFGIKKTAFSNLVKDISYYNCNNSPDLFTNIKSVKEQVLDPTIKQSSGLNLVENYFIVDEGKIEVAAIDSKFSKGPGIVYWLKNKASMKIIAKKKVKLMVYKGRLFLPLPIGAKKPEFVEIIAYNNKYILAGKWHIKKGKYDVLNGRAGDSPAVGKCYVFDRNYDMIKGDIALENVESVLSEYFKDCSGLSETIKQNLKFKKNLSEGFTYYGCGDSKPPMDKWE